MNLITRNTDYAIQAILYVAASGKPVVSTAEIQEKLQLPRPFMRKIFQKLQQEQILVSIKGNKGGFALAKSPDKIFVSDILNVFQGAISLADCQVQNQPCRNQKHCPMRKVVKNIEHYAIEQITDITIAMLINGK